MKVVGYCRLSPTGASAEEKEEKLQKQKTKIREHCDEEDKQLVKMFVAKGVSGRKAPPHKRTKFQEMMDLMEEDDEIEQLIVHHSDRISRSGVPIVSIRLVLEAVVGRDVEIYSTLEEKYLKKFDRIRDEQDMGEAITLLAQGLASDWEKKKEAMKTSEQIQDKKKEYKPAGRSPPGINTNKTVLEQETSEFYVPEDEEEFRLAIAVLNRYEDHNGSDYQLGRTLGIENNPGNTVGSIVNDPWKYYQAYRAMYRTDVDLIETEDVDFVDLMSEPEAVLDPLPE